MTSYLVYSTVGLKCSR